MFELKTCPTPNLETVVAAVMLITVENVAAIHAKSANAPGGARQATETEERIGVSSK